MPKPVIKRSPFPPGSHIFIYRHSRTNQVVYSLHHNLDDRNSKNIHAQLPFLGKKTKPAEIRTDLWRPYARVDFPERLTWKGLLAYRKLREYQMLRYYSWRTKGEASPISKKDRIVDIMDQSRTSVADLANVLTESEGWDAAREERQERDVQRHRNRLETLWRQTVSLAEQGKAGKMQEAADAVSKARNSKETILARQQVNKYKRANEAVDAVDGAIIDEVARSRWNVNIAAMVEYKLTGNIKGVTDVQEAAAEETTGEAGPADSTLIQSPTRESTSTNQVLAASATESQSPIGAITDALQEINPLSSAPAISSIQIRWEDIRDAQWAQSWPNTIQHDQIGFTKKRLPFGARSIAPVAELADLREMAGLGKPWVHAREKIERKYAKRGEAGKMDAEAREVLESLDSGRARGQSQRQIA